MESPLCPPADPGFRLIETFLWTPGQGICRRDRHLARFRRSADRLGISPNGIDDVLQRISGSCPLRVRLTSDVEGNVGVTAHPFVPIAQDTVWRVAIAHERVASGNPWLAVKSTERALYDHARAALQPGLDEVIFLNENSELCEGAITNIFVDTGCGIVTPSQACGLLPGVLRQELLETGKVSEAVLTLDDLKVAKSIWVGNSLRGLIPARLEAAAAPGRPRDA